MSVIVMIILGAIVGWVASRLLGRDEGILMSIVIGIIGSFIGGWLSRALTGSDQSFLAFSWVGLFWSLVGALVLVAVLNMFSGRRHRHI